MTITIHFGSWVTLLCATVVLWIAAIAFAVRDSKGCGDYGVPLFGFAAVIAAAAATAAMWATWLFAR